MTGMFRRCFFQCPYFSAEFPKEIWKVGADKADYVYGFFSGFFSWLGFYLPVQLGSLAWEGKSWKLFLINAGYYFIMLQAMGMILAYWR